jgi:hypothetical protein
MPTADRIPRMSPIAFIMLLFESLQVFRVDGHT